MKTWYELHPATQKAMADRLKDHWLRHHYFDVKFASGEVAAECMIIMSQFDEGFKVVCDRKDGSRLSLTPWSGMTASWIKTAEELYNFCFTR